MFEVSLIIPVYNVSAYITNSLLSALNQTFESIEFIVIDDCGSDNSMEVVKMILEKSSRKDNVFIYKHEKNRGLSAARNTGLEKATGKYIFFMDSDDEITNDCIEKHYNMMVMSHADFTIAEIELVGSKSIHVKPLGFREKKDSNVLLSFFKRKWNVGAWNKLYKSDFLKENRLSFVDGLLHEDIIWSYCCALNSCKIVSIQEKTYRYKVRKGSITTSANSSQKIESLIYILRKIQNDIVADKISIKQRKDAIHYLTGFRFNIALLLLNCLVSYSEKKAFFRTVNSSYGYSDSLNIYSILLSLPFFWFEKLLKIPYFLYKK